MCNTSLEEMAVLNRFFLKATDKCFSFFKILKGCNKFEWTTDCEAAFQVLKEHLSHSLLLLKPRIWEALLLYLAVSSIGNTKARLLRKVINVVVFKPKAAIKGQSLANFVAKFANILEVDASMTLLEPSIWCLFIDKSSEDTGSGVGVVLTSFEGYKLNCAIRFSFNIRPC
ncbi:Uncharacterized protein Adt_45681 [Abeliophyllum distichum]|uniref:Reverse transcriptase/retrotransposon-derived protein RNase H-like domain-containing protein n=1 Tax=Abeliophyllum distichum TaxID=126358 RepID=A0ABD1PEC0_9LAMI